MRLVKECPICSKPLAIVNEAKMGVEILKFYKCGHCFADTDPRMIAGVAENADDGLDFTSVDGFKKARPYQEIGVRFILDNDFACVIGDQMRLGKTPQALLALKNAPERQPSLILVRSANLWQWLFEYKTWTNPLPNGIWPIIGSKSLIPPGFSAYICSMDTFSRNGMGEKLLKFGFKSVICDEAHSFKNPGSNRSQALIRFLHEISKAEVTYTIPFVCSLCKHQWEEQVTKIESVESLRVSKSSFCPACRAQIYASATKEKIDRKRKCGILMLTGTAIKNRADEYFVPLNILDPEHFSSQASFRKNWLQQNSKGQWSRIHPYRYEQFKKLISQYVLRREKEDVYTDLPEITRTYTTIKIEDEALKKAYNQQLDIIEEAASRSNFKFFDTIGELAVLRKICGIAKVPYVAEYAEEFLDSSERAKLAIGIHHHAVRDQLAMALERFGVYKLSGEDSAARKYWIMENFKTSSEQLLILNMLAGGIGMDFHYVDNVIILERQWSFADEEQFEFRFYNPDKSIKQNKTEIEYVIAQGTIDEFFYDLVEQKRIIFGETIGTHWSLDAEPDDFRQLVERTVAGRL